MFMTHDLSVLIYCISIQCLQAAVVFYINISSKIILLTSFYVNEILFIFSSQRQMLAEKINNLPVLSYFKGPVSQNFGLQVFFNKILPQVPFEVTWNDFF